MKLSSVMAVCAFAFALWPAQAGAAAKDRDIGRWTVSKSVESDHFHCAMSMNMDQPEAFGFIVDPAGEWGFYLWRSAWSLKPERDITISVRFDDDAPMKQDAWVPNPQSVSFFLGQGAGVEQRIRKAKKITVTAFRKDYTLALDHMEDAVTAITECAAKGPDQPAASKSPITIPSGKADANPGANRDGSPAARPGERPEWERGTMDEPLPKQLVGEAVQVAVNIQQLAKLDPETTERPKGSSIEKKNAQADWEGDGYLAKLILYGDSTLGEFSLVEAAMVDALRDACDAPFETAATSSGKGPLLQRRANICHAEPKRFLVMYGLQRSLGGFYLLLLTAIDQGALATVDAQIRTAIEPAAAPRDSFR